MENVAARTPRLRLHDGLCGDAPDACRRSLWRGRHYESVIVVRRASKLDLSLRLEDSE